MRKPILFALLMLSAYSALGSARRDDKKEIALQNWTVPSRIVPFAAAANADFVAIDPCRVIDTRLSNGAYGTPMLAADATRTFNVATGPCAGIPSTATALSLNFTVTGSSPGPNYSFITAFPAATTRPNVSSLNYQNGVQQSNAAIVRTTSGAIDVYSSGATELIVDINGYFASAPSNTIAFNLVNSATSAWLINTPAEFHSGINANATIVLQRGLTYEFNVGVSGHPFRIASFNAGPAYSVGVTNNDAQSSTVRFKVPMDAPTTLHYYCLFHAGMNGTISIP